MPFDVLEKKFRALPEQSFEEVSAFFDYMLYKFGSTQPGGTAGNGENEVENALNEADAQAQNTTERLSCREVFAAAEPIDWDAAERALHDVQESWAKHDNSVPVDELVRSWRRGRRFAV